MARAADTTPHSIPTLCRQLAELSAEAVHFMATDRAEALLRKWVIRSDMASASASEYRVLAMMADATQLATDLLLSQPSASGATAFDRLARSRAGDPSIQTALAALRQARFRLLRLEGSAQTVPVPARDVLSQEVLRIAGPSLRALPDGAFIFARTAMLQTDLCCLAGTITPLDAAAVEVAIAAPRGQPATGIRWAEAVYAHIVRNGTLDVPGLNRPADAAAPADDPNDRVPTPLDMLARAWAAVGAGSVDAGLLQRTRQCADLPTILDALTAAPTARLRGEPEMADAFERLLLVQIETVLLRERSGSGSLTLDAIGHALDDLVARKRMLSASRALFHALRRRLSGGGRSDDPALERLVQRIQGLRAKTVAHGCTEQEALAAAEKVAELLDRYGLSLGELDFRAQPCEGIGIQTDRRRAGPIDDCIPAIAAFFDCRVWLEQAKGAPLRYVFFGLRGDVAAAQYLYEMVERAFETETAAFRAGALYAEMAGERRSASNSFQIGLGRGIRAKLDTMRSARAASRHTASGRDLVPVKAAMVDEELAKLGLDLQSRATGRRRRVLSEAFDAGEAAGQKFEFALGVTQAA